MVGDFQRRLSELRFVDGIEKVEHVPYPDGDQFWVRFNRQLEMRRIEQIAKKHGASVVKFGGLPSKMPRALAEILWDGVSYVITKKIGGWSEFTAFLGFEPDGVAKIASDAHGPYEIFIATQEEGVQILYEYLDIKYLAPIPPPKPVATTKTTPVIMPKPIAPTPRPAVSPTAPAAAPPPIVKPSEVVPASPAQGQKTQQQAVPKGQYHPHAWGQLLTTSEPTVAKPKQVEEKPQGQTS